MNNLFSYKKLSAFMELSVNAILAPALLQSKPLVLACNGCAPCNCGLGCVCETLKKSKVESNQVDAVMKELERSLKYYWQFESYPEKLLLSLEKLSSVDLAWENLSSKCDLVHIYTYFLSCYSLKSNYG